MANSWHSLQTLSSRLDLDVVDLQVRARKSEFSVFASTDFAEFCGLATTVHGEVTLTLGAELKTMADYDAFWNTWNLDSMRTKKLEELSGGWARYLALACFVEANRPATKILLVNAFRYLAPGKAQRVMEVLLEKHDLSIGVVEPDLDILGAIPGEIRASAIGEFCDALGV